MQWRVIAFGLAAALAPAGAGATCTPWPGSDETGCLTRLAAASHCEQRIGSDLAKLATGHLKCQQVVADTIFKTGLASAATENACKAKAASKLVAADVTDCGCVDPAALAATWQSQLDAGLALVYCDQTGDTIAHRAPGSTDAGWVTPYQDGLKCEDQLTKLAAKLIKGMLKCHQATAKAAVKGVPVDDEACEGNVQAIFAAKAAALAGCRGCESPSGILALAEALVDANNAAVYCTSPSGAFVTAR